MSKSKAIDFLQGYDMLRKEQAKRSNEMHTKVIFPYNDYSKSAKLLAREMGFARVKRMEFTQHLGLHHNLEGRAYDNLKIINWGSWNFPPIRSEGFKVVVLNGSKNLKDCAVKTSFFDLVKDKARVPQYTKDFKEAMMWVREGHLVLGRSLTGSGGKDICFSDEDAAEFEGSQFWTVYKKKSAEFRVHIVDGEVILIQKKVLRTTDDNGNKIDNSNVDFRIRNHNNGFIFQRNDVVCPDDVVDQARKAIEASGLDFGAVDIIWNNSEQKAYVLEVNTAPGLEGSTIQDYARALTRAFEKRA